MSYTLTVIHPPISGAAYGKALTLDPVDGLAAIHRRVSYILATDHFVPDAEASDFASTLTRNAVVPPVRGTRLHHTQTGLVFVVDDAENAPHPCPCDDCGREVRFIDHAYADAEDAYCTGCFTWNRDGVQCLPENTAHSAES